jgi:hypothetical protein
LLPGGSNELKAVDLNSVKFHSAVSLFLCSGSPAAIAVFPCQPIVPVLVAVCVITAQAEEMLVLYRYLPSSTSAVLGLSCHQQA